MPFPLSFGGQFALSAPEGQSVSVEIVAERIERALQALHARDVERFGNTITLAGPAMWTARRSNPLANLIHGEVEVIQAGRPGVAVAVRYRFRPGRGLGVVGLVFALGELWVRAMGDPATPPFLIPGLVGGVWSMMYLTAWVRVPLFLMRAAEGELEQRLMVP